MLNCGVREQESIQSTNQEGLVGHIYIYILLYNRMAESHLTRFSSTIVTLPINLPRVQPPMIRPNILLRPLLIKPPIPQRLIHPQLPPRHSRRQSLEIRTTLPARREKQRLKILDVICISPSQLSLCIFNLQLLGSRTRKIPRFQRGDDFFPCMSTFPRILLIYRRFL